MKRCIVLGLPLVLALALVTDALGNGAPPKRPAPAAPGGKETTLKVVVDDSLTAPVLRVPKELVGAPEKKTGMLDNLHAPTVVAAVALTLAFATGGLWLFRRGHKTTGAMLLAVGVLCVGAPFVAADLAIGPRPPRPMALPANLVLSDKIHVEVVEKGEGITLVVQSGMLPPKGGKTAEKP